MERERWETLYALAVELSMGWSPGVRFSVATIVGVYLWSLVWDRPVSWACQPGNWPVDLRRAKLPTQSTMSRRLRSRAVEFLLECMEHALRRPQREWVKTLDGKPLPIGVCGKDRDAGVGRRGNIWIKGYKLHAIWGEDGLPIAWCVTSMNASESRVAQKLAGRLRGGGYLLGDKAFDSGPLHDIVGAQGHQLVAPPVRANPGRGHHRPSSFRLRSVALLNTPFGKALYRRRNDVERDFSGLVCFGGGLACLPSWVRHLHRVRLWVQGKLLVNAVRLRTLTAVA
jgi:transposase